MKDIPELKPSEMAKKYGFSSLNEVSRESEISAKTLIKWSRTEGHKRRFHLIMKGLVLERFCEWAFSKATLLRKNNEDANKGIFATNQTINKLMDIYHKREDEVDN